MILVRDIETRSTLDVGDVGVSRYATHPTTEVLCVGYCLDEGPVKIWKPGDKVPSEFKEAKHAAAHNAPFEMAIERAILGPRYGFPVIPVERNICSMAIAHSLALPAALGNMAKVLNLDHQKDVVGGRLMLQLARPRRARKKEDPDKVYYFEDDDRLQRLYLYCIEDVETAREAICLLPWLSDTEYKIWLLDQKINGRGLYIDAELCRAARKIIEAAGPYINELITRLTNGQVTSIHQVARLTGWLKQYIPDLQNLDKKTVERLLADGVTGPAREALELRAQGAQAATKKIDPLLDRCDKDGRLRDAFVYHAAGTGRWSSRGAQLHNLKRIDTKDVKNSIDVIRRGDFVYARQKYSNPLAMIGGVIRAMIKAAPGNVLLGADFSGIEARVTAWIAGEESKLDVFREFDAGRGPDPYIVAAAKIFNIDANELNARYLADDPTAREQRQIGKGAELAFGYQGGVVAYKRFIPDGLLDKTVRDKAIGRNRGGGGRPGGDEPEIKTGFTDAEIDRIKFAWRKAHPNIERFWHKLNKYAWKATAHPGDQFILDNIAFEHDEAFLWLTLPSGRKLAYPHARLANVFTPKGTKLVLESKLPWAERALIFKDNSAGQWRDVRVYGGLLCENVVQAIARDILAEAMLRLDACGLNVVGHVHDEAIIEVAKREAASVKKQFARIMKANPAWSAGLPIAIKVWESERYTK